MCSETLDIKQTINKEGNNVEQQITVAMTAKEFKKHNKVSGVLTDLQETLKYNIIVKVYTSCGSEISVELFKTIKKANKYKDTYLQNPNNIGHTIVIFSDKPRAYTTDIPIIEV